MLQLREYSLKQTRKLQMSLIHSRNTNVLFPLTPIITFIMCDFGVLPGADPGFVFRGGVSRRGVWGPLRPPAGPG
jgi:hypothetical protein